MVRVWSSVNSVNSVGPPTPPVNLCKSVQSVEELFSTLLQNRLAEGVLPQNSRNSQNRLAEDVLPQNSRNSQNRLAEMFSHRFHRFSQMLCFWSSVNSVCSVGPPTPPSGSVKIRAICGRIVLVAWGLPSYRIDWQRVSSHRIHGIHRMDLQRCSPTDFTDSHRCCVFGVL